MNDQVAPLESVLGSGAGGPLTAPTPWLSIPGGVQFSVGGVLIGNPTGGIQGTGSVNLQQLFIQGVLVNLSQYLLLAGGTMTGVLALAADPVNPMEAANKRYIDNLITAVNSTFTNYLPIAGGTITGNLTISGSTVLSADPTTNLQAATKHYVDQQFAGMIVIPDAPADGSTYGRNNNAWTNVHDAGTY